MRIVAIKTTHIPIENIKGKASKNLNKGDIELPVEETDIVCDLCGTKMIVKSGRFGKFVACPNYPKCKNTKPLTSENAVTQEPIQEKADFCCEVCGSEMVLRQGKFGDFYACVNYPKCKYTKTKNNLAGVICPDCGAEIISKFTKSKKQFYSCVNYPKCQFSTWDIPTDKKCPVCSDILLRKKNKNYVYCRNENCDYSIESE